jgi:translocator protein
MIYRLAIFLLINFLALGIGGVFTKKGVTSDWYFSLAKAPWTPPGWVFGAAWTTIMICFSLYMMYIWSETTNKKLLIALFSLQWILNILWNPLFFHFQHPLSALIVISMLTILVGFIFLNYFQTLTLKSILILPYFIWLIIATSLNAYILIKN